VDKASTKETTGAADLAGGIRAGDQGAEDELVRRYSRGVFIIINNIIRNRADAEEMVQETLVKALEKIRRGELREPEKLSGFVCGIARNLAQGHTRKARGKNLTDINDVTTPVDPGRGPLEQLLQKEEAEIVRQVLGELRMERDREVIIRFYLAGEEKESICASLGLTSAHFNRVIFRALARFRELYEEKLGGKTLRK
jgi:RNA polymerase sigma-70 factor, ECF subfamily